MRWANGQGTTTELAIHPADAGLGRFHWRVSLAHMMNDAAFSILPGVDRTLVVVDGDGIDLVVESQPPRRLDLRSDPFGFPADAPAHARLVSGPVSNLNVMTRRGCSDHRVERLRVDEVLDLPDTGSTVIYAVGALTVGELTLAHGDAAILGGSPTHLRLEGRDANAIVVRLRGDTGLEAGRPA